VTGVFVIGAMMMLFLTFSISNPLYDIEQKAEKLVQFDFTDYLEIKHNDEIGSLSKSLNQLSYNLECSLKELNGANDKLKLDMAKNREIEKVRKEFIRNISHDFKTPLGVIRAFAEGLEDGVLAEEDTSYYTTIILEEVATLEALVNDMLELSKLQTGAYQLEIEEFHMNHMINSIIEKNQRLADKKEILLSFISTPYDMVFADYRKLSRVIQNFVSNAIQYSEEGRAVLIQTEVIERKIRFEIHNVCDQLPQEDLKKIWDKFYRMDEARTKSGAGSGLGLAIAKEILEQHRCEYGVANTSKGIVFYFEMDKYVNHIV
jgi:signal transduction histidine kinase